VEEEEDERRDGGVLMSIQGFLFLGFSWTLVSGLVVFCFYNIFRKG
jgi:hypothetical protein